jgi:hypothetical protein
MGANTKVIINSAVGATVNMPSSTLTHKALTRGQKQSDLIGKD